MLRQLINEFSPGFPEAQTPQCILNETNLQDVIVPPHHTLLEETGCGWMLEFLLCPRVQSWAPQHPQLRFLIKEEIAATCQPGAFLLVKASAVAQSVTAMSIQRPRE